MNQSKEVIEDLDPLLDEMWRDYVDLNPQAKRIWDLFTAQGETVVNDHIALRTFNLPRVGVDVVANAFVRSGYEAQGSYEFPEKKLVAKHYESPGRPKLFISELQVERFEPEVREAISDLVVAMDVSWTGRFDLCVAGRPWDLPFATYERLRRASEYAAWVAAFGFRPNHFTVLVNELQGFDGLEQVNAFLEQEGFVLNEAGGKIKGGPDVLLEQSSVIANNVEVMFQDGPRVIPGCYYEFAKRHPGPDGKPYQGFVAASANRIFESTDRGQ